LNWTPLHHIHAALELWTVTQGEETQLHGHTDAVECPRDQFPASWLSKSNIILYSAASKHWHLQMAGVKVQTKQQHGTDGAPYGISAGGGMLQ